MANDKQATMLKKFLSKEYRAAYAEAVLSRSVSFQIRAIRKGRKLSQQQLADLAGIEQGVVSRACDPDYGKLTLATISRIAAGFDLAFIGQFVSFKDLAKFSAALDEKKFGRLKSGLRKSRGLTTQSSPNPTTPQRALWATKGRGKFGSPLSHITVLRQQMPH